MHLPRQKDVTMTQPNFDSIKQIAPNGCEVWRARDLMPLLGYSDWKNFYRVIEPRLNAPMSIQSVASGLGEGGDNARFGKKTGHTRSLPSS